MMDFSTGKYEALCKAISGAGYTPLTVAELVGKMEEIKLTNRYVTLRHDVDRLANRALELAKIENKYNIKASYYFRIPSSFNIHIIKQITSLGHEIGLHYECVDKAGGDMKKAASILKEELDLFEREFGSTHTVSMHGNPLTKFDNRDLWQHYSFEEFGLTGEVYLSIDFEKTLYYSDTGRTWEENKFNIKDVVPPGQGTIKEKPLLKKTDHLILLISTPSQNKNRNIYILTHPERWNKPGMRWIFSFSMDLGVNMVKTFVKLFLKLRSPQG